MERKTPNFVLAYGDITYIVVEEDLTPHKFNEDPIIKRPRRLG